ncbi:MAG: hypothetical protein WDA29_08315 [Flavobacteriaceae bacterium]
MSKVIKKTITKEQLEEQIRKYTLEILEEELDKRMKAVEPIAKKLTESRRAEKAEKATLQERTRLVNEKMAKLKKVNRILEKINKEKV